MAVTTLGAVGSSGKKGFSAARRCGEVERKRTAESRGTERNLALERRREAITAVCLVVQLPQLRNESLAVEGIPSQMGKGREAREKEAER